MFEKNVSLTFHHIKSAFLYGKDIIIAVLLIHNIIITIILKRAYYYFFNMIIYNINTFLKKYIYSIT